MIVQSALPVHSWLNLWMQNLQIWRADYTMIFEMNVDKFLITKIQIILKELCNS